MLDVIRVICLICLVSGICLRAADEKQPAYPFYDYDVARAHEIKPLRRTFPLRGVRPSRERLRLKLTVSPTGDVMDAEASGTPEALKQRPEVEGEVRQWKFRPFEDSEEAVTAEVAEYVYLVPPERLPQIRAAAPAVRPDSKVEITLQRTGCFGTCPSYSVTISTTGIRFDGRNYVVVRGKHTDKADADEVRKLGERFVAADFYSMDASYRALVTDNPTYVLSIAIDGATKRVEDYVGSWVGMPAVITELEDEVDSFARTHRWIEGGDGLVQALQTERFDLRSFAAQVMMKEAASRGKTETVRKLLEAGVPLEPLPTPEPDEPNVSVPFDGVGWLTAASGHPATLAVLIKAGASRDEQSDKDLALAGAARSGDVVAARALIAYGADPNADLGKLVLTESHGGMTMQGQGAGSLLINAAASGNPEMVREILRSHPMLEMRDREGRTAVFVVGKYWDGDEVDALIECLCLLLQAGANVNASEADGNSPLHEAPFTNVAEELLKLGASVNARNNDGEIRSSLQTMMMPYRYSSSMAPTSPFGTTRAKR